MRTLLSLLSLVVMLFIGSTTNANAQHESTQYSSEEHHHHHHHHEEPTIDPKTGLYSMHENGLSYECNFTAYHILSVVKKANWTDVRIHILSETGGDTCLTRLFDITDNTTGTTFYLISMEGVVPNQNFHVEAGVPIELVLHFPQVSEKCNSITIEENKTNGKQGLILRNITGFGTNYVE